MNKTTESQNLEQINASTSKNAYETSSISQDKKLKQLKNQARPTTKNLAKVCDFNISEDFDFNGWKQSWKINKIGVKSHTSVRNSSRQKKSQIVKQKSEGFQPKENINEIENGYFYNSASENREKANNSNISNSKSSNKTNEIVYNKAPFDPRWRIRREKSKIETSFKRAIASLCGGISK